MRLRRTPRSLDDRTVEALLAGRTTNRPELQPLAEVLTLMSAQRPAQAPASERLERMFAEGVHPITVPLKTAPAPASRRTARASLAALAAVATVAAGLVGAASANALPAPAQRAVAYVIAALSPLTVPQPADDTPAPTPTPTATHRATTAPTPAPRPTRSPAASPRPSLHGPDVVVLPPPTPDPDPSAEPSADVEPAPEPSPDPTDEP